MSKDMTIIWNDTRQLKRKCFNENRITFLKITNFFLSVFYNKNYRMFTGTFDVYVYVPFVRLNSALILSSTVISNLIQLFDVHCTYLSFVYTSLYLNKLYEMI